MAIRKSARAALAIVAVLATAVPVAALVGSGGVGAREKASLTLSAGGIGAPLFDIVDVAPGWTRSGCLSIGPDGAGIRNLDLSGSVSGALAQHLRLTVERGIGPPTDDSHSCDGFNAQTHVFQGWLSDWPDQLHALGEPGLAAGERRTYRFTLALGDTAPDAAQGEVAGAGFTFDGVEAAGTPPPAVTPGPAVPPGPTPGALPGPGCQTIPPVSSVRTVKVRGARLSFTVHRVNDPLAPLRLAARLRGAGAIRGVAYRVNGRLLGAGGSSPGVPLALLVGAPRRNRLSATLTLDDGRRRRLEQHLTLGRRCALPRVACARLSPRRMRCTARVPRGAIRARVAVGRGTQVAAAGSAPVRRGRLTLVLRARSTLASGRYTYRHGLTTRRRGELLFAVRTVTVR